MTFVPNASVATVATAKVRAFLLNEGHAGNRGRAKFFSLFGFNLARWESLMRRAARACSHQSGGGNRDDTTWDELHGALLAPLA